MKKIVLTLICICLASVYCGNVKADDVDNQQNIDTNELTGHWVFEKLEILDSPVNGGQATVKATVMQTRDLQPYAFCFYRALLDLIFISENRLMFESLASPMAEAEYRLIDKDNGATQLEILVLRDGEDVPVPDGGEYLISREGTDRLKIKSGGDCLNGESMACYLKRI
jgi:hypothetical protein